jgi:hypothetical protein
MSEKRPKRDPRKAGNPGRTTEARVARETRVQDEVRHIISCAQHRDGRIARLGILVFFSTATGDAWMLDREDSLALCLARDGDAQPVQIVETATQFFIDWDHQFTIKGDAFTVVHKSGRVRTIMGYPTRELQQAMGRGR